MNNRVLIYTHGYAKAARKYWWHLWLSDGNECGTIVASHDLYNVGHNGPIPDAWDTRVQFSLDSDNDPMIQ